jgi:HSP20 family protein
MRSFAMNLIRTSPWGFVNGLSREVDRLLQQPTDRVANDSNWVPRVDIRETEDAFVLTADVPGVNPDDLDITLEDDILALKGSRNFERESQAGGYHRVERSQGAFQRQFRLPESVATDGLSADYRNGVLSVTIPKQAKPEPHRVQVQVH